MSGPLSSYRHYGTRCAGCNVGLCPEDLVRRAVNKVYHVQCFVCSLCKKQLTTGEQLYLLQVGLETGCCILYIPVWCVLIIELVHSNGSYIHLDMGSYTLHYCSV